jgi:hypothetical protein
LDRDKRGIMADLDMAGLILADATQAAELKLLTSAYQRLCQQAISSSEKASSEDADAEEKAAILFNHAHNGKVLSLLQSEAAVLSDAETSYRAGGGQAAETTLNNGYQALAGQIGRMM